MKNIYEIDYDADVRENDLEQVIYYVLGIINAYNPKYLNEKHEICNIGKLDLSVYEQTELGKHGKKLSIKIFDRRHFRTFECEKFSRDFDPSEWGMTDEDVNKYEEYYFNKIEELSTPENQELLSYLGSIFKIAKDRAKQIEKMPNLFSNDSKASETLDSLFADLSSIICHVQDKCTTQIIKKIGYDCDVAAVLIDELIVCYSWSKSSYYAIIDTNFAEKGKDTPFLFYVSGPTKAPDLVHYIDKDGSDKWWFDKIHNFAAEVRKQEEDEVDITKLQLNLKKNG